MSTPEHEKQQKLLEDILYEVYNRDGASFLETDNMYTKNNLFTHMACAIRKFVLEGNSLTETERRWENRGPDANTADSLKYQEEMELKKHYRTTALHIPKTESNDAF